MERFSASGSPERRPPERRSPRLEVGSSQGVVPHKDPRNKADALQDAGRRLAQLRLESGIDHESYWSSLKQRYVNTGPYDGSRAQVLGEARELAALLARERVDREVGAFPSVQKYQAVLIRRRQELHKQISEADADGRARDRQGMLLEEHLLDAMLMHVKTLSLNIPEELPDEFLAPLDTSEGILEELPDRFITPLEVERVPQKEITRVVLGVPQRPALRGESLHDKSENLPHSWASFRERQQMLTAAYEKIPLWNIFERLKAKKQLDSHELRMQKEALRIVKEDERDALSYKNRQERSERIESKLRAAEREVRLRELEKEEAECSSWRIVKKRQLGQKLAQARAYVENLRSELERPDVIADAIAGAKGELPKHLQDAYAYDAWKWRREGVQKKSENLRDQLQEVARARKELEPRRQELIKMRESLYKARENLRKDSLGDRLPGIILRRDCLRFAVQEIRLSIAELSPSDRESFTSSEIMSYVARDRLWSGLPGRLKEILLREKGDASEIFSGRRVAHAEYAKDLATFLELYEDMLSFASLRKDEELRGTSRSEIFGEDDLARKALRRAEGYDFGQKMWLKMYLGGEMPSPKTPEEKDMQNLILAGMVHIPQLNIVTEY